MAAAALRPGGYVYVDNDHYRGVQACNLLGEKALNYRRDAR